MTTEFYPKWRWYKNGKCVVEVLKRGHFPSTLIVRLPDDTELEVEYHELENPPQ